MPLGDSLRRPDQAKVGFVNERGRLQGVTGRLVGDALGGQMPQVVVHKLEQALHRSAVSRFGRDEQLGEFRHAISSGASISAYEIPTFMGNFR